MISLTNLELTNFLSHVSTELPLREYQGLILIEGKNLEGHYSSNGSGKSTLLEGIIYALSGDTLRGISVNDIINRNYKKNTKVSLGFTKDDIDYNISRYRKDEKLGDSLILSKEGKDISKRTNKETQKSIEDIIGISYKLLVSTILLGEGLSSRFTQLSDPEKKSLIENTLNLEYDIATIRMKANNELTSLRGRKSTLDGKISALEEVYSLDVDSVVERITQRELLSQQLETDILHQQNSIESMRVQRDSLNNKLAIISKSISELQSLKEQSRRLDEQVTIYVSELTEMEDAEVPLCTVCHQQLNSDLSKEAFRENYKKKVSDLLSELANVNEKINSLPDDLLLEQKYKEIRDMLAHQAQEMSNISESIRVSIKEKSSYDSEIEISKKSIIDHEESKKNIESLKKEQESISLDIDKYEYFYKLFSPTGIIVDILLDAIGYINSRLSVYTEVLLEKDYKINFVKGKINLIDSKGSSYQSLSNGEKRRLDIAIQFSLHDYVTMYCGMKVDCCFIDEILDTLDDIGVENIFEVLRMKLAYCQLKSIYVITHNDNLKNKFDKVITVKKDRKGDSYLE